MCPKWFRVLCVLTDYFVGSLVCGAARILLCIQRQVSGHQVQVHYIPSIETLVGKATKKLEHLLLQVSSGIELAAEWF